VQTGDRSSDLPRLPKICEPHDPSCVHAGGPVSYRASLRTKVLTEADGNRPLHLFRSSQGHSNQALRAHHCLPVAQGPAERARAHRIHALPVRSGVTRARISSLIAAATPADR